MAIVSFSKGTGALSTLTQIQKSETRRTTSISKISSSLKIRKASDAVADSAIGTKLKVEVDSLKQLLVGTAQAKAALDIAEGGLGEITKTLTRMNTLAMSAKNGIYKRDDISKINQEFVALIDEIDRIAKATTFNSKQLLSGTQTIVQDNFEQTINGDNLRDGFLSKDEQGIDEVIIDSSKNNTGYIISYNQETRLMRVTTTNDKNVFEERKVAADDIAKDKIEELNFSTLGVKVRLNSNFDKRMSIGTDTDNMMNPQYNQNNLKNLELINYISEDLLDLTPGIAGKDAFTLKTAVTEFKIEGESNGFNMPTKIGIEENVTATLGDIKTAMGFGVNTGLKVSNIGTTGGIEFTASQLETVNSANGINSLEITSVKVGSWDTTPVDDKDVKFGDLTSFKVNKYESDTGTVIFEAVLNITADTATASGSVIQGSFRLDKSTYDNGITAIDYDKQSIAKAADGKAIVLRGGTYELKSTETVGADGYVYDEDGNKVKEEGNGDDSTIQLKLLKTKTRDVDVSMISGNVTDLTTFDVKIEGTNGKAKLYIDAVEGRLESDWFNLTDIDYNDGNAADGSYDSSQDNSTYIAEKRLERGRVILSRTITNGGRVDSIAIDFNKLKTGGLFEQYTGMNADQLRTFANQEAGMKATAVATFQKSASIENNIFVSLNELKNTVVAYQETSDKTNLSFQVGTGSGEENSVNISIDSITAFRLQLIDNTTNQKIQLIDDQEKLGEVISIISSAIDKVQTVRSDVAVGDNRLNFADSNIQTTITNSQAAASAIFDLDIPEEMVELSQSEMMEQSSIEALAKEMRIKQNLLKLF